MSKKVEKDVEEQDCRLEIDDDYSFVLEVEARSVVVNPDGRRKRAVTFLSIEPPEFEATTSSHDDDGFPVVLFI